MSAPETIVVIGIGNILMSDEGVGVRVVERLMAEHSFPDNVEIYDGGSTGLKGLMPLIEDADHLIVIDAIKGPGEPGALYRYSVEDFRLNIPKKLSAHDVGLLECLTYAGINEKMPESVIIIGVKPFDMTTPSMELSGAIHQKVSDLVDMSLNELRRLGAENESVATRTERL
ncbi:hypothetical protein MNBD_NITROSPINAE02-1684 [hydrothermal vent metagenome]|uniref:Hydrogenase maturation protease n=1 Tax=hydrothermal vent metagenome TaxID=652676 RepID=A0A3B1D0J0_9ZZZZ